MMEPSVAPKMHAHLVRSNSNPPNWTGESQSNMQRCWLVPKG